MNAKQFGKGKDGGKGKGKGGDKAGKSAMPPWLDKSKKKSTKK